jgi:hypothetical protein
MYACNRIGGINNNSAERKFEKMQKILNVQED